MSATRGTNGPAFMGTFTTQGNPIYRPAPMKPPTQPSATPRTEAMREKARPLSWQTSYGIATELAYLLETELAAAKAIHAELEDRHLQLILARSCGYPDEIPASERAMQAHTVQSLHAELASLRAEVERLKTGTVAQFKDAYISELAVEAQTLNARAERAEVEVERLTVADHAWRTAAKFDAHNAEVLRAEIGRLNTQIATHIRDRDAYPRARRVLRG